LTRRFLLAGGAGLLGWLATAVFGAVSFGGPTSHADVPVTNGTKSLRTSEEQQLVDDLARLRGELRVVPLASALAGHTQTVPRTPRVVATDRGFGSKDNEAHLRDAGLKQISLLYKGRPGAARAAHERQRWFRRQQRWRSGQEATISLGSRKYEWRRSRLRGRDGADTWIGLGILTHNLDRLVVIGATR